MFARATRLLFLLLLLLLPLLHTAVHNHGMAALLLLLLLAPFLAATQSIFCLCHTGADLCAPADDAAASHYHGI